MCSLPAAASAGHTERVGVKRARARFVRPGPPDITGSWRSRHCLQLCSFLATAFDLAFIRCDSSHFGPEYLPLFPSF